MKLYNAYYICKENVDILEKITYETLQRVNNVKAYKIRGWSLIVDALTKIQNIPFLKSDTKAVYETIPVFVRGDANPEIDQATKNTFVEKINTLKISMITTIDLYESVDSKEKPIGIDVRIPECENLKQYIGYLEGINFVFTQCPYLTNTDERIEFRGTDVGSMWLTFVIAGGVGTSILLALARLIDSAVIVKSHMVSLKQQEVMLDEMKVKDNLAHEIVDIYKEMKHRCIGDEITKLSKELGSPKEGDEEGRLEKSIEKLSLLLDKGVQIYSSIDAPSEVQSVFPPLEKQESLITQIKGLIEETE